MDERNRGKNDEQFESLAVRERVLTEIDEGMKKGKLGYVIHLYPDGNVKIGTGYFGYWILDGCTCPGCHPVDLTLPQSV